MYCVCVFVCCAHAHVWPFPPLEYKRHELSYFIVFMVMFLAPRTELGQNI